MSTQPMLLDAPLAPAIEPEMRFVKRGKWSRLHIVNQRLAQGLHPLGHAKLAGINETCGTCSHVRIRQRSGRYIKCNQVPMTGGPASDVRLKWPACTHWCPGASR